ncbi:PTS sugar transporter subunit IIC, partial [Enterococcus faecalis]|uniref:PTS sugar transporter subunit IIC n=1 Tax=Enterococcus faecalis TaxID=1351 RepID=UPI003CC629B0
GGGGRAMNTLFTVGGMLPCVGIAFLLRHIVNKNIDFVRFFVGFTLAASLKLNLVTITYIALRFAVILYKNALIKNNT